MVAIRQILGQSAYENNGLKISRRSRRAIGSRAFRNIGGIPSKPVGPLHFVLQIADVSSPMASLEQLPLSLKGVNSLLELYGEVAKVDYWLLHSG